MAASETVVGNAALSKLGESGVLNFDAENEKARWLKSRFPAIRDLVLRSYPWTFAMKRASLSADSEAPAFGYARAFALPDDCIRLYEVDGAFQPANMGPITSDGGAVFAVEGRKILTDLEAPLPIRFVSNLVEPPMWDPLFDEALACRVAYDLAEKLTQSSGKREAAMRDYMLAVREAERVNAIESPPEEAVDGSWVTVRR
jgi:hypothetical protein